MAVTKNAPDYYINETALSFTPNYQGLRDVVYVSIVSDAAIAVYKDGIPELGYGSDASHQRWKLTGYTTKLGTTGAYYIYARLSRTEKKAMILFSVNDYDVYGRVGDGEASTEYWYIRIGDITASTGNVDRQLNYDSGILGTNRGIAESNTLLEKMFKWNNASSTFSMLAPLTNLLLAAGATIEWGGRAIRGIVGIPTGYDSSQTMAQSEDELVTPKFVKAYGDLNYLSKKNDDTVEGNVSFEKSVHVEENVNVGGDVDVAGSQTVHTSQLVKGTQIVEGAQDVKGLQTLHEGFETPGYHNAAGQITGAQLTKNGVLTVSGLIARSFEIFELIYNKIRAQGGRATFSDTATIERCVYAMDEDGATTVTPEEFYTQHQGVSGADWEAAVSSINHVIVTFKKDELTNNSVPFVNGDIIYGYVNGIGESGQYARGGMCSMHIISSDDEINLNGSMTVKAALSPIGDVSSNPEYVVNNMPPTEGMTVAQNGNVSGREGRTTSFFIDSESGHIIMLQNVTTPTVATANYAVISGLLPADLLVKVQKHFSFVKLTTPVSYAKYGIFENFLQLDHDGEPIKTERNRGAWSAEAAVENPYVGSNAKDVTYYDTVTHNGALWKCLVDHTTEEPSSSSSHWLLIVAKGNDSVAASYTINPSVNVVYYETNSDKLSADSIDVTVGVNSADGYSVISSQDGLTERGLTLYYSIDGGELNVLNISDAGFYELENGEGVLEAENGTALILEGEEIPVSSINKNITLYLKDESGDTLAVSVIPVVKDGSNGKDGLSPQNNLLLNSGFDKPLSDAAVVTKGAWYPWNTAVQWEIVGNKFQNTNALTVAHNSSGICYDGTFDATGTYVFSCLVFQSAKQVIVGVNVSVSCNSVYESIEGDVSYSENDTYRVHSVTTERTGEFVRLSIRLHIHSAGDYRISLKGAVLHENFFCQPKMELSSEATPYRKAEADLVGPAGDAGPLYYPAGKWNEKVIYTRTKRNAPFVYYEVDGKYYTPKNIGTVVETPPSDDAVWEYIEQYEALFAKFLMANFALFGSDNGAVFYDRYLFSQDGYDENGDAAKYGDYIDTMFKNLGSSDSPDYRLSGDFRPNLLIDFLNGALSLTKFSEPYLHYETPKFVRIDPLRNHNVSLDLYINDTQNTLFGNSIADKSVLGWRNPFVLLPEYNDGDGWFEDGQVFTVLVKHGGALYGRAHSDHGTNYAYRGIYALVGVDSILAGGKDFVGGNFGYSGGAYKGNWFIWRGYRSKFVVLTPGTFLRLKLHLHTDDYGNTYNYWYIENSYDFMVLNATVKTFTTAASDYIGESDGNRADTITESQTSNAAPEWNLADNQENYKPIVLGSNSMTDLDYGGDTYIVLDSSRINSGEDQYPVRTFI